MKTQLTEKTKKISETIKQTEDFPVAHEEDFPTRRALEELNEMTRKHYVTKHGAGTQTDQNTSPAIGPIDQEA